MSWRTLRSATLVLLVLPSAQSPTAAVEFTRAYRLNSDEGVFAYARISPDGRQLAYASEAINARSAVGVKRFVRVVDLRTQSVTFTTPGVDAYWSNDGKRLIYRDMSSAAGDVAIRDFSNGAVYQHVGPVSLGDYYSWAVRDGRDVILTILGNYYYLDGNRGVMPSSHVPPCAGIGSGERPLISKDGKRISAFSHGDVIIRDLTDCDAILDTHIQGAKADFSWDGRYVAFHAPKLDSGGYEIEVVDTVRRTVRSVGDLPGSSFFPSWTRDGRLCFRYDGDDYHGFMIADHVLRAPERPLPAVNSRPVGLERWEDIFPETPWPEHRINVVMVWATWSAHSPDALADLQSAEMYFRRRGDDVASFTALDGASVRGDANAMRRASGVDVAEIQLSSQGLRKTAAVNQIPTTILFKDGVAIQTHLGAQSFEELRSWVASVLGAR
jgi:hypothetical protein